MARRNSDSEAILFELTKVHWGYSATAAALVYVILRMLIPAILSKNPLFAYLATAAAQVALPMACLFLLPGAISFGRSLLTQRQFEGLTDEKSIQGLSWLDFEANVGEAFRRSGYVVEQRGGRSPDGGVDLVLHKDGVMTIAQCKHWKARPVGVTTVRELLGVVTAARATSGILATSGTFTQEARDFARDQRIALIDGAALWDLIQEVLESQPQTSKTKPASAVPNCPSCSKEMILRVAKKGTNPGQEFWGCRSYPTCRGTRPKA